MLYQDKSPVLLRKKILITLGVLIITIGVIWVASKGANSIQKDVSEQTLISIKNAVLNSAVQCYAVEGSYPESLSYLEDKYGLRLNRKDYIIDYEVFASNVLPNVTVLQR